LALVGRGLMHQLLEGAVGHAHEMRRGAKPSWLTRRELA
jgi:hypothetical protein